MIKNKHIQDLKSFTVGSIIDTPLIIAAWLLSYIIRFNIELPLHADLVLCFKILCILIPIQLLTNNLFELYRSVWQFISINNLIQIIKSTITASLLVTLFTYFFFHNNHMPRSVPYLYAVLCTATFCAPRLIFRWVKEKGTPATINTPALIIGAGIGGESLIRDLQRQKKRLIPVGIVDDNANKLGREIHGIRVLGSTKEIKDITKKIQAQLALIAIPSANSKQIKSIVAHCEEANIPYRTLPTLNDIALGHASITTIREISIEDLLSRETIKFDWEGLNELIINNSILVTGGGGSIGSELCRQVCRLGPKNLLIVDHSEYNLFKTHQELTQSHPDAQVTPLLLSITDKQKLDAVFAHHKPDLVFHAAAYKHVPLLEHQAEIAIANNIIGTKVVAETAIRHGVKKFTLISTDKAVHPTNVMGASKRCAEIFCHLLSKQSKTEFITVRFGNVLGSAGSAIPTFKEQISKGGPVTVTHPEISRYFMTISEACQLIMQATNIGSNDELYVLDMGDPIKIDYLVKQLIKLSCPAEQDEIKVTYTGLRPGEKLYEELFYTEENPIPSQKPKLLRSKLKLKNLDLFEKTIHKIICTSNQTSDEIKLLLMNIIQDTRFVKNESDAIDEKLAQETIST